MHERTGGCHGDDDDNDDEEEDDEDDDDADDDDEDASVVASAAEADAAAEAEAVVLLASFVSIGAASIWYSRTRHKSAPQSSVNRIDSFAKETVESAVCNDDDDIVDDDDDANDEKEEDDDDSVAECCWHSAVASRAAISVRIVATEVSRGI
jgi:hypothetical protein